MARKVCKMHQKKAIIKEYHEVENTGSGSF